MPNIFTALKGFGRRWYMGGEPPGAPTAEPVETSVGKRVYEWSMFGKPTCHVVIDYRKCPNDCSYSPSKYKIELADGNAFTPLIVIPISERLELDEYKKLAQQIADRLTAAWVEDQMGG